MVSKFRSLLILTLILVIFFFFGAYNLLQTRAEVKPDDQIIIEQIVLTQVNYSRFIKVEINNNLKWNDSSSLPPGKNILIHFVMEMLPDWEARDIVNWFSQDCYEIFKDIYHDDWDVVKIPVNEVSIYGYLNQKLLCRVTLTRKDAVNIIWDKVSVFNMKAFISDMTTFRQ